MRKYLIAHFALSFHLLIIGGVLFIGAYIVHYRLAVVETSVKNRIANELVQLARLEDITSRNGADESIPAVISDCPRRALYDEMLSKLGTLSHQDLITMQQLFESCSPYYPELKAFMVAQLQWHYTSFASDVDFLTTLNHAVIPSNVMVWKSIIDYEKSRSDLLKEQTDIQGQIIAGLISGSTPETPSIVQLVSRAQEIARSLTELSGRIETVRNELTP